MEPKELTYQKRLLQHKLAAMPQEVLEDSPLTVDLGSKRCGNFASYFHLELFQMLDLEVLIRPKN